MPDFHSNNFNPPSAEQVSRLLAQYPPRPPSRLIAWGPILVMGGIIAAMMSGLTLLGWLIAFAAIFGLSYRVRYVRRIEAQVAQADELTMLRHWSISLQQSWQLVPRVATMPNVHGRVLAMLAHALDQLKSYEAAIVVYDFLISHLPADHPAAIQLRINRTFAQLHCDQLLDADDTLRRLRHLPKALDGTPIAAALRLAILAQQVQTNHYEDALDQADNLLEDLRPLGVTAGFGHGLMALVHYHLSEHNDQSTVTEAGQYWRNATLLLSPAALVERYPQLEQVAVNMKVFESESTPPKDQV